MDRDRRRFLHLLAGSLSALPLRGALAVTTASSHAAAPEIHRQTRNTRAGALGAWLRSLVGGTARAKPYTGKLRVELPAHPEQPSRSLAEALARYSAAPGFSGEPISLAELARLLRHAYGVTGQYGEGAEAIALRAAPSAGALYAGEVYVVAERVEGLAPGVYYYALLEGDRGKLARLRDGDALAALREAVEQPDALEGAAAALLLTNVFARYTHRYGYRGYRYALVDSGHIAANLELAAHSAGLGDLALPRFHDARLDSLLGIDGREEAVCVLHAVGRPAQRAAAPAAVRRFAETRRAAGGSPIERYHAATRLAPAAERGPSSAFPPADLAAGGVALPPAEAPPGTSVEAAITVRRSTRRFEAGSLSLEELAFALRAALASPALARSQGVDLCVVAHRVRGLEPGLYRVAPRAARLVPRRLAALAEELADVCLGQSKAREAAVACVMIARFARPAPELGDRRYRDQLLEAGSMGQRLYLAAEAQGLSARNLAAFRDDELGALLGLDASREGAIHLTLLGRGD